MMSIEMLELCKTELTEKVSFESASTTHNSLEMRVWDFLLAVGVLCEEAATNEHCVSY